MKRFFILLLIFVGFSCGSHEPKPLEDKVVGGPCEDCEALLDYKVLALKLSNTVTLPGFQDNEPKIKITGTVLQSDGKTPAKDVIVYVYHTDRKGIYQASANPIGYEKRHGQHRGWMITDDNGRFSFNTFRPAAYPNGQEPEHIHIYIKEPGKSPYYIDSYLFEDDPGLTPKEIKKQKNRGGSGLVKLDEQNGVLTADRDIILGKNIPNY